MVARVRDDMEDIAGSPSGRRRGGQPAVRQRRHHQPTPAAGRRSTATWRRHSVRVRPGQTVSAGTPLGRVGLSGATVFPHLHFTVRHKGAIIDPFAFGAAAESCGGGAPLVAAGLGGKLELPSPRRPQHGVCGGPRQHGGDRSRGCWRAQDRRCRSLRDRGLGAQHRAQKRRRAELIIRAPDGSVLVDHSANSAQLPNRRKAWCLPARSAPPSGWPRASIEPPTGCWRTGNRCWSRASR